MSGGVVILSVLLSGVYLCCILIDNVGMAALHAAGNIV